MALGAESHGVALSRRAGATVRRSVRRVGRFLAAERGATMVEHALLMVLLSLLVALTLFHIGTSVRTRFSSVSSCLTASSNC
jgi:Flp pilus assembly pilin Flp